MAKVTFGMYWQEYGHKTIDLPDDINPCDEEAVKEYILSVWDEISLPDGGYVEDSAGFDEEGPLLICPDEFE